MRNLYSDDYRYLDGADRSNVRDDNQTIAQLAADEDEPSPAIVLAVKPTTPTKYYALCSRCRFRTEPGSYRHATIEGLRHNESVHGFKGLGVKAK